jgi:glyoxylase-like metal-dependent hydrolase (beta-lactamase superfamily II)
MRMRAMTCGWLTAPLGAFLEGEPGRIEVPVPCYLIEHPNGRVLLDSGLHADTQTDPEARLGEVAQIYRVRFAPGEEVSSRLAACDVAAERVEWLVTSHLHFDHTGGHAQIPNARLVVQRREWEAGRDPDGIAANFYDPRDYDLGHDVLAVAGEHDLFGDGSVVCLPTPGHTPGHQSLRVRLPGGDAVLCADACSLRRSLEALHLPAFAADADEMRSSLTRLRGLQQAGARLFFGHDPGFWADIPQAPAVLD